MGFRLGKLVKPACYALLNIVSASGIVFANKAVFETFGFKFVYMLTLIHTLFTWLGMVLFRQAKLFETKTVHVRHLLTLSAAFVGYIVLCNLNLQLNPVGFYQISKIAVAPAVLLLQAVLYGVRASTRVVLSVFVVCGGVAMATVSDPQLGSNMAGMLVGLAAVAVTAVYQLLAGAKQRELGAGSMQLLEQYSPIASAMLAGLVLCFEPVGLLEPVPGTLRGYAYTPLSVFAIMLSALLGLLVSLSTFLVIGATSSLTYNVVGHVKTVIILAGGCLFFGDEMPPKKLLGISVAMSGIIWYSHLKLSEASKAAAGAKHRDDEGGEAANGDGGHGEAKPLLISGGVAARARAGGGGSGPNSPAADSKGLAQES